MIHHAVVLKNYVPEKNKLVLLHEQFGKITIYITQKDSAMRLCNGTILYCSVDKKNNKYQLHFIDPYFVVYHDNQHDLYFLHQILKICLDCMPSENKMGDVFDLVLEIYKNLAHLKTCHKKIYILRLFLYLDIFPESSQLYQAVMQSAQLHEHKDDILLDKGIAYCFKTENYA